MSTAIFTSNLLKKLATNVVVFALISGAQMAKAEDPNVDPAVRKFLGALSESGGKPMEQLNPVEARMVLAGAQLSSHATLPAATVEEKTITVGGKPLVLSIVRPVDQTKPLPAFMFFHGGGWVIGDFPTHERLVRDLVTASGFVAVFVNYSRSPEVKYPVAVNESYEATKWVAEHGKEINVDGNRLAVVGNSAGGNIATVVAMLAKEKGTPLLKSQILFWPVTDFDFETSSYNKFESGYFLTKNMMKWFWNSYAPSEKERNDPHVSPLRATVDELRGLPPTLIQSAENDVLRDEGEAYGRKLNDAGVDVTSVRYNGLIHDYGLLNAISQVPGVRAAIEQAGTELKKRL